MSNDFSILLKEIIKVGKVKNNTIATATGYDLSYISKWLSGSMLPSEKSIEDIAEAIASCVYPELNNDYRHFSQLIGESEKIDSPSTISKAICRAYYNSKGKGTISPKTSFHTEKNNTELYNQITKNINESEHAILVVDFFSLDRETRLIISGIRDGRFIECNYSNKNELIIVISPTNNRETVYNGISLIHFISGLSRFNIHMYFDKIASSKLLYSGNNLLVSGVLLDEGENETAAVSIIENLKYESNVNKLLIKKLQSKSAAFIKQKMNSFVQERQYFKSMLSTNIRWLLGHITELVMPDDLFETLMTKLSITDQECYRIHELSKSIIEQDSTSILIYENAISDLIATGEVDFFNQRAILSKSEKEKLLNYLHGIILRNNFRLISGIFFSEYEHVFNPALYLSDTVSYIRFENAYERENIYQLVGSEINDLVDRLFNELWVNRPDVVIADKKIVGERIDHYRDLTSLIS